VWGLLSFHARRLARLLPAVYIMIAVGWLAGLEEFRDNIAWHAGFLPNVHMCLLPTLLLAYAGTGVFRAWCLHTSASDLFRWFMLPGSLDAFAAGGLVARKGVEIIPRKLRLPVAALAIAS
jgi:peptidoglycan/LPS O-acetylase OafA/YrhL